MAHKDESITVGTWEDDWMKEEYVRTNSYETMDIIFEDEYGARQEGYATVSNNASVTFTIYKCEDGEKSLVSGWANVAKNADGSIPLDWQGDIIDPQVLEDAAVDFMMNYRESGEIHEGDAVGTVVESIVFTKDKQAAIGIPEGTIPEGWFITVKIHDQEVFEKVKSGEYSMFSIQGSGERHAV